IYAKVIDAETGRPIEKASVSAYSKDDQKLAAKTTDEEGFARIDLPGGKKHYDLQVSADNYNPKALAVPYRPEGKINMVIELQPIEKIIQEEKIDLKPIHFEFDKAEITKQG